MAKQIDRNRYAGESLTKLPTRWTARCPRRSLLMRQNVPGCPAVPWSSLLTGRLTDYVPTCQLRMGKTARTFPMSWKTNHKPLTTAVISENKRFHHDSHSAFLWFFDFFRFTAQHPSSSLSIIDILPQALTDTRTDTPMAKIPTSSSSPAGKKNYIPSKKPYEKEEKR